MSLHLFFHEHSEVPSYPEPMWYTIYQCHNHRLSHFPPFLWFFGGQKLHLVSVFLVQWIFVEDALDTRHCEYKRLQVSSLVAHRFTKKQTAIFVSFFLDTGVWTFDYLINLGSGGSWTNGPELQPPRQFFHWKGRSNEGDSQLVFLSEGINRHIQWSFTLTQD